MFVVLNGNREIDIAHGDWLPWVGGLMLGLAGAGGKGGSHEYWFRPINKSQTGEHFNTLAAILSLSPSLSLARLVAMS